MIKPSSKIEKLSLFVGNTPLLVISATFGGKKVRIYAKYEAWNFSGSIKDRMTYQILKSAYENKIISPKDVIVEATSGNTGIALAAMGAYLGHKVEIYMPDWLSAERKKILEFYGAKLFQISQKQGGFTKCIELAAKKSKKKGYFGPKQFENTWNVFAHYRSTAPEVDNALKNNNLGSLDVFVGGVGTGGTIMGFYRYFSEKNPNFHCIPVLPTKNEDGEHRIEGIGDSFVPKILSLDELSPIYRISDIDALKTAQQLNKMGLSVGISSGANVFAALEAAAKHKDKTVATILCDCNKKYLSTDLCSQITENTSSEVVIEDYEIIS